MRQYALDLTRYWQRRTLGDITVYMTWFGPEHEPVIVLIPTYRQHHEKATPCVVPLTNAFKWDEYTGDPVDCANTCIQFAEYLGLNPHSIITAQRIASIIRDSLGDLLHMPPKPSEGRQAVADAYLVDESGKRIHLEVTDDVR